MQKNSGEIFEPIQVDPITGKYFVNLPEEIVNELSWYEDTEVKISLEGDEIILTEKED
jgi:hypothetical protein